MTAHLIFADGLHLLVDVFIQQLHGLLQTQVVALSVQNVNLQLGQVVLQLDHQHLLIVHCNSHGM